jgi:peptidoglycan hydrolase CwlO-like protein
MSKAIFRAQTPEEAELARQRRELAAVREVLAARERELEHLRDQLFSFEGRYIRQVGVLYRQLEEWEERIAELLVSRESPEDRAEKVHKAQEDAIAAEIDAMVAESQDDAHRNPRSTSKPSSVNSPSASIRTSPPTTTTSATAPA